jgi:hypothetical protein
MAFFSSSLASVRLTVSSLRRYPNVASAEVRVAKPPLRAPDGYASSSSFRQPALCWSNLDQSNGNAMGPSRGSKRQGSDCTTTRSPSRGPTSSLASPGRFSTRGAPSRASRPMRWRPDQRNPRAVLGPVKAWLAAWKRGARPARRPALTAPCAPSVCTRRPERRNGRKARTKEQRKMRSYR